jgi:molybdate transport system substrate-binding protein
MNVHRLMLGVLLPLLCLLGCTRETDQKILVASASSFANAISQDAKISYIVGSSSQLLTQIRAGAPLDVVITASPLEMNALADERLIDVNTRKVIAGNRLVVVTKGNTKLGSLAQLKQFRRIAIASPASVPLGRYTQQALATAGVWSDIEPLAIQSSSAAAVKALFDRGEVDAAILYQSDAANIALAIDPATHDPVVYEVAILSRSTKRVAAAEFIARISPESIRRAKLLPAAAAAQSR